ncbi:MAG: LacI family DNA-binding transcriptional regulator [Ktedonobacteraceae bacterium]
MTTTIHDVARIAGVGIGTVSRVINNSPGVKPATRSRVLSAIAQLNYRPNPIARSMISKRTGAIGVIVPFFTRPFHTELLRAVQASLSRSGKELVLYDVENVTQRNYYLSELPMLGRADGLLLLSLPLDDEFAVVIKESGIPVVLIDTYSQFFTSLVVENIEGAYQAVKYLIELGHRRIGFINGVIEGNIKFNQANDRLIGLHRAFGEAGLLFEPQLMLTSEWNRSGGKQAALQLLSQENRPTAIFAASDMQAIGVLEAAKDLHLNVPDDVSVIGFDGIEVAELLELSTIQQPMQRLGELGVRKLNEIMKKPQQLPELIRLNTTLIARRTTRALTS